MTEQKNDVQAMQAVQGKKKLNIFQKMLNATNEIQTVAKNLNVQVNAKNSYKAVGERDILDAVKPIEFKNGIYSYPYSREIIKDELLETESQYGVRKQMLMRIKVVYRFVNVDDPRDFIEIKSYADGIDSGDKASGKAMTYADKYALMKAYKISTGEDPDQTASEELKEVKASGYQIATLKKCYIGENMTKLLASCGIDKIEDISKDKASELISKIMSKAKQKEQIDINSQEPTF